MILPKLFRRLSKWEINTYAGMVTSGLRSYVQAGGDECHLTDEFLAQPTAAPTYRLHDFLEADGYFALWPEELVFRESDSRLIGPGGVRIDDW